MEVFVVRILYLVKSTDERMSLIEPEENVKGPFQFGEPDVKAGHAKNGSVNKSDFKTIKFLLLQESYDKA